MNTLRSSLENLSRTRKELSSESISSSGHSHGESDSQGYPFATSSEDDSEPRQRRSRRPYYKRSNSDIKIEILEFEGRLDPDEFLR